jgi:hypothetical protein
MPGRVYLRVSAILVNFSPSSSTFLFYFKKNYYIHVFDEPHFLPKLESRSSEDFRRPPLLDLKYEGIWLVPRPE